ncbi:class I SAM-dependent methyltransferase [Chlorogloeopsis sp. ULAP01]|uniref:class I SAM-dependent methyltransferase n=1 Tax=Chlorogloeopsis sp. ULAP01 TaxID=3056483 RepID=UPI0025AA441A|nr:class I SAM-dependent methyltransferase [Chlorogloeopsis sp. ULAP01]MDM9383297.1 class I SAM-dependent methyltransferase [Chlorogloeopsis sp. ULAP01]
MYTTLQEIYAQSSESVRATGLSQELASEVYGKYVQFINQSVSQHGRLLDVGCGSGWSSYLLSQEGYQVVGIDLNAEAFECPNVPNLTLVSGSAMNLPFEDASFDVVASHQAIEHIPEPQKAIMEMIRVLKPGGILCIVGPNLLSIGHLIKAISVYAWQNRPIKNIFWRSPHMPKHPWGNTLPEALVSFPLMLTLITRKLIDSKATFTMREPDINPPFHADNDACYMCNPIDFVKFLPTQNCVVIQNGFYGRLQWTTLIASGTFIAARKLIQDRSNDIKVMSN